MLFAFLCTCSCACAWNALLLCVRRCHSSSETPPRPLLRGSSPLPWAPTAHTSLSQPRCWVPCSRLRAGTVRPTVVQPSPPPGRQLPMFPLCRHKSTPFCCWLPPPPHHHFPVSTTAHSAGHTPGAEQSRLVGGEPACPTVPGAERWSGSSPGNVSPGRSGLTRFPIRSHPSAPPSPCRCLSPPSLPGLVPGYTVGVTEAPLSGHGPAVLLPQKPERGSSGQKGKSRPGPGGPRI